MFEFGRCSESGAAIELIPVVPIAGLCQIIRILRTPLRLQLGLNLDGLLVSCTSLGSLCNLAEIVKEFRACLSQLPSDCLNEFLSSWECIKTL